MTSTRYWLRSGAEATAVGPLPLEEIVRRHRWGELLPGTLAALDTGRAAGDAPPVDGSDWRPIDAVLRDPVFAPGTPERIHDERRCSFAWLDRLRRTTHHRALRAVVEITIWSWAFAGMLAAALRACNSFRVPGSDACWRPLPRPRSSV